MSDVRFFDPVTGDALQTVSDPPQQVGSTFGIGMAPLGDLNEDGFLDFAVGAGRYDAQTPTAGCPALPCVDVGRVYISMSDETPPTRVALEDTTVVVTGAPGTASNIEAVELG